MRRILVLVALASCGRIHFDPVAGDDAATPGLPWTLIQSAAGKPDMVTVAPIGTGNSIVVAMQTSDIDVVTSVTDNTPGGSNTYVAIPAAHAIDANAASGMEIWYATNSRPGATTLAVAVAAVGGVQGMVAWEISWSPTVVVDAASGLDSQPATTAPTGAPVTTTTAGAFIVSVGIFQNSAIGAHPGNEFTNDALQNANGWAHITSASSPAGAHEAQWDQTPQGTYCSGTAAFRAGP